MLASTTTVELKVPTKKRLDRFRSVGESNDEAINRALNGEGDVYIDIISIDDELAKTSGRKVVFQIGVQPARYYLYHDGAIDPMKGAPKFTAVGEPNE